MPERPFPPSPSTAYGELPSRSQQEPAARGPSADQRQAQGLCSGSPAVSGVNVMENPLLSRPCAKSSPFPAQCHRAEVLQAPDFTSRK